MKIVIADDHALLTEAIRTLMRELDPTVEVVTSATFGDAVRCLERHPDTTVLLLDLDMPGMEGAASIAAVREHFPAVRCAILTGNVNPETVRTALSWGIDGFVPKHMSGRPLLQVLRLLAMGEKYVPPDLLVAPEPSAPSIEDELTDRELSILHLVAEGRSNKEIARQLGLEPGTVGQHLHHTFAKLRVNNRIQATRVFLEFKRKA